MSRKMIIEGERMASTPFSLSQRNLAYIERTGSGKNMSEKLRSILEDSERFNGTIVRYNRQSFEEGDFTPEFQADGAILVYYKTQDGYGYGDDLPFTPPKFSSWSQLSDAVSKLGYTTQIIKEPEYDFTVLWAIKTEDKCFKCKVKIKNLIDKAMDDVLCL